MLTTATALTMIHKIIRNLPGPWKCYQNVTEKKIFLYFEMGLYKLCYDQIRGKEKLEKTGSHSCL